MFEPHWHVDTYKTKEVGKHCPKISPDIWHQESLWNTVNVWGRTGRSKTYRPTLMGAL